MKHFLTSIFLFFIFGNLLFSQSESIQKKTSLTGTEKIPLYQVDINGNRLYIESSDLLDVLITPPTQSMYLTGDNTGVGVNAAIGNAVFGYKALQTVNSLSIGDNTAIGVNVLRYLTTGHSNTAVGADNMIVATSASENVAIGDFALGSISIGDFNTAVGSKALTNLTNASNNTAVGGWAGSSITTGVFNVAMGRDALLTNQTSNQNVAIGATALKFATNGDNTALGTSAGIVVTTGEQNVLIGSNASTGLTTGSRNIVVGYNIDTPLPTSSNTLNIGGAIFGSNLYTSSPFIGVGTNNADQTLTVNGKIKVGDDSNTATVGSIRYNAATDKFQGFTLASGWVDLH